MSGGRTNSDRIDAPTALYRLTAPAPRAAPPPRRFDYTDLFLWSTMSGEFRLAELFWPLTGRPLATAMIGSYVCKYMLNEVFIGHAEIEKQAATMQGASRPPAPASRPPAPRLVAAR